MATSSRQTSIFGTNDWKAIYKTFRQADFQSYDFETLRKSFIDYLKAYYPETFNDYIDSSEYVALLDIIAFMGQSLAFRGDLNARENFIDTAERRDSVIKLANLVGYVPKRNLAGQGFLKVTSLRTTENVFDINGNNLNGVNVIWNDPANASWLEQFNSLLNAAMIDTQRIGRPGNSQTILGVKTDEYALELPADSSPVFAFQSRVSGMTFQFETMGVTSINDTKLYEVSPKPTNRFNVLYRNDKLGYGSPNTGFFMYFKQGNLIQQTINIAQQTANQIIDVDIVGVNNEDVWLYQVDSTTGALTEWTKVDNVYSADTSVTGRKIFSVKSRVDDRISYVFGDGVFSDSPVGTFKAYVRSGNAMQYVITPNEMQGITLTVPYISRTGSEETLSVTLGLQLPVNNAQERETLDDIKLRAPSRFYTQNRMVNGEDYNSMPYAMFSSIIKSKALNRTSVGVSRNLDLLDPTGKYSSTNVFADDGAIYRDTATNSTVITFNDVTDVAKFFTDDLRNILAVHRSVQYYLANYARYPLSVVDGADTDNRVYWKKMSVSAEDVTGYAYTIVGSDLNPVEQPLALGIYSSNNLKYVAAGSMLKISAPAGYYFSEDNRLVQGIGSKLFYWVTVSYVIEDGYNNGVGALSDGTGPVTLSEYVPSGAIIATVIPPFDNSLSSGIIQTCISRMSLRRSFSLVYYNSVALNLERWAVADYNHGSYFVNFRSDGEGRYTVTYRSLAYYFGSVADVRFVFNADKLVYDRTSGKIIQDYVVLPKINTLPNANTAFNSDVTLSIVGQQIENDGYVDDYAIEVASVDPYDKSVVINPDFFAEIAGTPARRFVFFKNIVDANLLTRKQIVATTDIVSLYGTKNDCERVKYDYAPNQVFYAYIENAFYISKADATTSNVLTLELTTDYVRGDGRQGFVFQYRHNSNNTTRVDPSTSNIIDMYVVTQGYYTDYQNWIRDTTGTVAQPIAPDMYQLSQAYAQLQDYKMMSDSIILNSVQFKPLFGSKAAPALRATIKVTKASSTSASDGEIKSAVLSAINDYFSIDNWDFGDTFYFSELSAFLHSNLGVMISSAILVSNNPNAAFGDLYEIRSAPYEIFTSCATASDIVIVSALTAADFKNS